jgi:hypothetical protein
MAGDRVDQRHVVAPARQVGGVRAGTAPDVQHPPARRHEAVEDVPGAQPNQVAEARSPQAGVLVVGLVTGDNAGVDLRSRGLGHGIIVVVRSVGCGVKY